jgi:CelD/BcsL family acetyltransferase involved in cellulose biosynthesis
MPLPGAPRTVRFRPMPAVEVDEVTTSGALKALSPAWDGLWRRAPAAAPFQSPAWLLPWWREIGDGDLRVLVAYRVGRLVGLLPMYLQHGGGKLLPLGIATSDYLDGVFEADEAGPVAGAMLRWLTDRRDWRRCELHPLRSGSPLLEAPAPPGCSDEVVEFEPCLVVEIPPGAQDLDRVLPRKIRANLRYFHRRADEAGRISFETATAATLAEFLDALFRLHDARWRQLEQPGVLADPAIRRFHRAAAPLLLRAGLLRLHALRLEERIIAVMYALHVGRRTYLYVCGFDPEFPTLSPGTLIFGHSIAHAIGEGAREVDFLRGRERYKYFWGARERRCYGRMLDRAG